MSEWLKKTDLIWPISFFLLVIISRVPFMSSMLYHMDSVQFALALEHYDVAVHQPHPPGYFLYVMLGRFFHLFIADANRSYIFLNILLSGLTVTGIYHLGKEIFDKKTGVFAAAFALVSPTLWFHGVVALSYASDAFFSTALAVVCWKIQKGEKSFIWLSAVILAIAGGIRQNTAVFLFPFWLYAVRGVQWKNIVLSVGLFGLTCLLWFVPMVLMTGGWSAYWRALELLVEPETYSSARTIKISLGALPRFTVDGLRAGLPVIFFAAYLLVRHGRLRYLDRPKAAFLAFWILSPVFFYLTIGLHPRNSGYSLIFLPPLFVLTAASAGFINETLTLKFKKNFLLPIWTCVLLINIFIFVFGHTAVSYPEIRQHDKYLSEVIAGMRSLDPSGTVILTDDRMFFGYNELMYYLPQYRVHLLSPQVTTGVEARQTFWGTGRRTYLSNGLLVPAEVSSFCAVLFTQDRKKADGLADVRVNEIIPGLFLASGPISVVKSLYPDLKVIAEGRAGL